MPATSPTTKPAAPDIDCTKEIRFAIVMYGGVSLAIYINGVAQEFFRMVRATAKDATGNQALLSDVPTTATSPVKNQLLGTERVYRKLSYLLSDAGLLAEYRNFLKRKSDPAPLPEAVVEGESDTAKKLDQILAENKKPINTRFVVDILSGTSAGGINGIHLAKALANNQNIDQLKSLWINEGDISLLLNDKGSVGGLGLANQNPPQSLLNSRRMYLKLLKSLEDMGTDDAAASNFVDELDLFITATDIEGVPVPIRLSDTVVRERRHRTVFHFQYSTAEASGRWCNDFIARNNPFLAYAARCTSSFPFAFEPMRLCDIDKVLDTFPEYRKENYETLKGEWTRFFRDYIDPGHEQDKISYLNRSFGDGGYLDNKPFTYSTDTLANRHAPVQVDRKLVYIEPSPEHPEDELAREGTYDALQNVKAAVLDLPSYETIREDLQRVVSRNDLINRVNRISAAIEKDLDQSNWSRPRLEPGEWRTFDLAAMVQKFGIYYLPYRRLRISSATEELAKLVARCLNLDTRSATFFAIRSLVRGWRELNYPDYHQPAADAAPSTENNAANDQGGARGLTANQFLIDFDFKYWVRRLLFISKKIDQTCNLLQSLPNGQDGDALDSEKLTDAQRSLVKRLNGLKFHPLDYAKLSAEEKREVLQVLVYLKCEVSDVYKTLRIAGRNLEPSGKDSDGFAAQIGQIKIDKDRLDFLLGMPGASQADQPEFSKLDEDECARRAQDLLLGRVFPPVAGSPNLADGFQRAAVSLKQVIQETVVNPTWLRCEALFKANQELPPVSNACAHRRPDSKHTDSVREYLWRYFSQFDDFDQISFPILFGTDVGEADVVEIIRISPEDAVTLVNERQERKNSADGIGRQKLAGTSLHHFGAFLDRTWRQNDIMWGRLDGAERLITSLLPEPEDKDVRAALIQEAHTAILIQEIPPENRVALGRLMSDALMRASAGEPIETAISKVIGDMDAESPIKRRLHSVMCNSLEDNELLKFIATSYEVNRKLDPKSMLRVISRSTQVVGNLFEDLATRNSLDGNNLAWIARLGQVFWGLVEVAVPNSLLNLLVFHWLRLLYVFEIILILGATLLPAPDTLKFAWTALGITAAVNITVLLLRDRMRLKKGWLVFVVSVFTFVLLSLAALGAYDLWQARTGLVQTVRSWVGL